MMKYTTSAPSMNAARLSTRVRAIRTAIGSGTMPKTFRLAAVATQALGWSDANFPKAMCGANL